MTDAEYEKRMREFAMDDIHATNEKCAFYSKGYRNGCSALIHADCKNCGFCKTEEELKAGRDAARKHNLQVAFFKKYNQKEEKK